MSTKRKADSQGQDLSEDLVFNQISEFLQEAGYSDAAKKLLNDRKSGAKKPKIESKLKSIVDAWSKGYLAGIFLCS